MLPLEVRASADAASLAAAAAHLLAVELRGAVAARGQATMAVSGGTTPWAMLAELVRCEVPWEAVHLFQVDERVAPDGDADRNLTALQSALLDRAPIPPEHVHPMPVTSPDLRAAAAAYADELAAVCGEGGALDVVHLGLGDDGHTASWPPGDPVIDVTDADVAVVGPYRGHLRLTLTLPVVNRAVRVLWLVSGAAKVPALRGLLDGDLALPAAHVRRAAAVVLADRDALGEP
ncbi:MAG: 6-phosphogluconolactonase [Acidimicrobiales bacterium]|nr:6-phosphogluconolactonase [Acidimicrobiales bacterium]